MKRIAIVPLCFSAICVANACSLPVEEASVPPSVSPPPAQTASVSATPSACLRSDLVKVDCTKNSIGIGSTCAKCSMFSELGTLTPNETDPQLGVTPADNTYGTNPSAPHCYSAPTSNNGLLFVFLPGSGAVPSQYQKILHEAHVLGYHALGLSWPNGTYDGPDLNLLHVGATDQTAICGDKLSSPDCWGEVRQNRFTGASEPHAANWTDCYKTSGPSAVTSRLVKALVKLNWTQFLDNTHTQPLWSKIVLSGHSQGGGLAAFIASQKTVKGVVTFSSPDDAHSTFPQWTCSTVAPPALPPSPRPVADWVKQGSSTPLSSYVGLLGCQDVGFAQTWSVWNTVGGSKYAGSVVNVDTVAPPYINSHQLVTSALPNGGCGLAGCQLSSHFATVVDNQTPDCPAKPANPKLKPAWQHMLIVAGGLAQSAVKTCSD